MLVEFITYMLPTQPETNFFSIPVVLTYQYVFTTGLTVVQGRELSVRDGRITSRGDRHPVGHDRWKHVCVEVQRH